MTAPDAPLRAFLRRPYPEQIAAFRLRLGTLLPTQAWDDLQRASHDRAFTVAGATQADLLADLGVALDKAIAQGTSLEEFRRDFRALVVRHGWHGWTGEGSRGGEAWRTRVIYQTNMRTSYAAGRMAQLREAGFRYWIYRHGGSREPRPLHLAIDGLILPSDHPFWDIWAPPNGWGCSCWIVGAHTMRAAIRRGGKPGVTPPEGWDQADPRTGTPKGIDRGWDYGPGASVSDTVTLAANKISTLPPQIGSDYGRSLDGVIDRAWPVWVAETRAGLRHQPALAGVLDTTTLQALARREIVPASSEIVVRPGLLTGPKAARHDRAGDALTDAQWERLPALLRSPRAILIDPNTGALAYVIDGENPRDGQIVVRLDYRTRINRDTRTLNTIVSAYQVSTGDLIARLAGGLLELLVGAIR